MILFEMIVGNYYEVRTDRAVWHRAMCAAATSQGFVLAYPKKIVKLNEKGQPVEKWENMMDAVLMKDCLHIREYRS